VLTLRDIRPADLPIVSALGLRSKASWGYQPEHMAIFTAELTHSEELLAESLATKVAILNERIVGYHTLRRHPDSAIELGFMFVDPDHFGKGIGTTLMNDAIAIARGLDTRQLILISDPNAVGFYQNFGARIIGQHNSNIAGRQIPIMAIGLTGP
jgi:GNAT superfamily N-acetyltransferase